MRKQIIYYIIIGLAIFMVGLGIYNSQLRNKKNLEDTIPTISQESKNVVATTLQKPTTKILPEEISFESVDTCKNEEHGYEFNYPQGWNLYEIISGGEDVVTKKIFVCTGDRITISKNETNQYKGGFYPPKVDISVTAWNDSSQKYLENLNSKTTAELVFKVIKEETISGTAKAIWYTRDANSSGVFFFHKNEVLALSVDDYTQQIDPKFLENIVSTIKLF